MRFPDKKTVVMPVCSNLSLPTDGTTSFSYLDIDVPQIQPWGPAIEQIRILTVTSHRMAAHAWAVFVTWSNTGRIWSAPVALHTEITADGETIEAAFTTVSDLAGRRVKLLLGARNTAGSIRNSALVSSWATVDFAS